MLVEAPLSDPVRDRPGPVLPHDARRGGASEGVQTGADPQQIHPVADGAGDEDERVEPEHVHLRDGHGESD